MTTREYIISEADNLIRSKGYNAFSFVDIASAVGIKKPSVHHHFPRKADLGTAVIHVHADRLKAIRKAYADQPADQQLERFFTIYRDILSQNKVCLVGSLATDYQTLDQEVQEALTAFSQEMLEWVTGFLQYGKANRVFSFDGTARTRAVMIISNMIAIVQLCRLTGKNDFDLVVRTIQQDLLQK